MLVETFLILKNFQSHKLLLFVIKHTQHDAKFTYVDPYMLSFTYIHPYTCTHAYVRTYLQKGDDASLETVAYEYM